MLVSFNVLVFAGLTLTLGFIGAHSMWRFFLRRQLPSLVHAVMPFLLWVYVAADFQANAVNFNPSVVSAVCLAVSGLGVILITRFELKQEHPWN